MVAEIKTPKSFNKALNYNEKKVQKEKADLLYAHNFLKLPEEMNIHDKKDRFEQLMALNERSKSKVFHVSINFHPSEKERLTPDLLVQLSREYMQKMGFDKQPYLVYQHHDAAHPHVHVLSTFVREDGSRMNTNYMGRDQSIPITREMEEKYHLVKANEKENDKEQQQQLKAHAQKVQYGKSETRRGIINVLDQVIHQYKYTSLPELNAVLKQYNVMADRGKEESRIYQNRGLNYRALDENGQKTGVPIKASSIYNKPTLEYLEKRFKENELTREPDAKRLKTKIDWTLHQAPASLEKFTAALAREKIDVIARRNGQGRLYGLTYIDHENKSVFNGSDLGKEYSAKRILERLLPEQKQELDKTLQPTKEKVNTKEPDHTAAINTKGLDKELNYPGNKNNPNALSKAIEQWMEPDHTEDAFNKQLTEEEKRRKKRQLDREL
jgi:hypothetical protein